MSVIPCHRGGHHCRWPACPLDCDGRPGSPTGRRVIPYEQLRRQEEAAWRIHQRMRATAIASGAVEIAPDMFDCTTADFTEIEKRIIAAMQEDR